MVPKIKIETEYGLPEELHALETWHNAEKYRRILREHFLFLRNNVKYGDGSALKAYDQLCDEATGEHIDLWEL